LIEFIEGLKIEKVTDIIKPAKVLLLLPFVTWYLFERLFNHGEPTVGGAKKEFHGVCKEKVTVRKK
jgi:hypothetical protein